MASAQVYFLLIFVVYFASAQNYRMCVSKDQDTSTDCNSLKATDSQVGCVPTVDKTECALLLKNGTADFGVFNAESVYVSLQDLNDATEMTHEIPYTTDSSAFQTVVVVRNSVTELRGMKYCHPGFDDKKWSDRILKMVETNHVIMQCNANKVTAIEEELISLNDFFGDSCRPINNETLREKYPKLCALCGNKENCKHSSSTNGHISALECLTKNGGEVAYVNYADARQYFTTLATASEYMYFCPDGSKQGINNPCYWYKEPWSVVLARKDRSTDLKNKLNEWIPRSATSRAIDWKSSLKVLVTGEGYINEKFTSLYNYIAEVNKTISTNDENCRPSIKWCTSTSEEQKKCNHLKRASLMYKIAPGISCNQRNNKWECLSNVQKGNEDIMGINNDLAFLAMKRYNLDTVQFLEPQQASLSKIIAVVKSNPLHKLAGLKGKKGCFPEFGGLAYLTVMETLRNTSIQREACPYKNTMGSFFEQTCIPNADQETHNLNQLNKAEKLCSLCTNKNCKVESGDASALKCLTDGADVAFIYSHSLSNFTGTQNDYKIMCKDGTRLELRSVVNEDCAFATLPTSQIVSRKNLSEIIRSDIKDMLEKMDEIFGSANRNDVFKMYTVNADDVLFKGQILGIAEEGNQYVVALKRTISESTVCLNGSNGLIPDNKVMLTLTLGLLMLMSIFRKL